MHIIPTAGCQISILIFEKNCEGGLYEYPIKIYQGRKVIVHFGLMLKVLSGSLTVIIA